MQPRDLELMRKHHPAWRLLAATHATLVISFLYHAFIARNRRQIAESELIPLLQEHLMSAREESGEGSYSLTAKAYLNEWASPDYGYLRVTFDVGSDDPKIDLTTGAERAIEWILTLQKQGSFIGTKSRLLVILDLLRQLRAGTDPNPQLYLTDLERQRRAIDDEIDRIVKGKLHLLPPVEIKERFAHVVENTRRLLSDLRGVEQNFRTLDLEARKRIASWEAGKGALLGELFKGSDSIQRTEQGQSFLAFWDFLMSRERQEELSELLDAVLAIPDVREVNDDPRLRHAMVDWMDATDEAQRTVGRLSEQLRRFLDDQSRVHSRRLLEIIDGVERKAIAITESPPEGDFMSINALGADIHLPLDRPLYWPPVRLALIDEDIVIGTAEGEPNALYQQVYIDPALLQAHIDECLGTADIVTLSEIITKFPLEQGLAEIVGYMRLASGSERAAIFDDKQEIISWAFGDGSRSATVPFIAFRR